MSLNFEQLLNNIKRDKHQGMLIPFMFLWSLFKRVELYAQAGSAAYVTALCCGCCHIKPVVLACIASGIGVLRPMISVCILLQ